MTISTRRGYALAAGLPSLCQHGTADRRRNFFMDRLAPAFRAEITTFTEVVAGSRRSPCTIADALETGDRPLSWSASAKPPVGRRRH
jgi:hypothetical protein